MNPLFPLEDFVIENKDKMLATKFIFIHMPRTGGSSLRRILPQLPGGHREISWAHAPRDFYAGLCALLNIPTPPSLVFIRNPWTWYPSQWLWQKKVNPDCPDTFREWMGLVKNAADKGLAAHSPPSITDVCPMSFIWDYLQADRADYIGRFEDLENEAVRILCSILGDIDGLDTMIRQKLTDVGRQARTKLPGGIASPQELYDAETTQWVLDWDQKLIDRY